MSVNLAFCLGFRAWHPRHLQRCLASLRANTDALIVVADLGEDPGFVDDLVRSYRVDVVHAPRAEWSRSVALNLAAYWAMAAGNADWLCFTDADMLFPASWFAVDPGTAPRLWLTRSRDLDEVSTRELDGTPMVIALFPDTARRERLPPDIGTLDFDDWVWLHSTPHGNDLGQGAATLVPRAWFEKVGGFDEFYEVWGCEDNDLTARATWDGLPVSWLPDGEAEAWVAHQWHRRDWPTPEQFEQVRRNRAYLAARVLERGPIVRNAG